MRNFVIKNLSIKYATNKYDNIYKYLHSLHPEPEPYDNIIKLFGDIAPSILL